MPISNSKSTQKTRKDFLNERKWGENIFSSIKCCCRVIVDVREKEEKREGLERRRRREKGEREGGCGRERGERMRERKLHYENPR